MILGKIRNEGAVLMLVGKTLALPTGVGSVTVKNRALLDEIRALVTEINNAEVRFGR